MICICKTKFANKHNLSRHIAVVLEGKKLSTSGLNESANYRKENSRCLNQTDGELHQCKYCYKTFRRECALQHEETHKEMQNEKSLESKRDVKFEPKKCEPKRLKTPYLCEICKKMCVSFTKLEVHKRIHTGEKPYSCSSCNLNFSHKTSLKTHELIHTDKKPYSCSYCTLTFRQKAHVQGHERVHVTKGHVRKYSESEMIHFCKACSKDFKGPENLRKHQEIHENTVCPTCEKEFSTPSKLEKHKMIHTGEKPHSCTYCTVKFRQLGNVRSHEKVHIARGHKIQINELEMLHFCKHCKEDNKDIIGKKAYLDHISLHKKSQALESIVFNPVVKSYPCKLCNMKLFATKHIEETHYCCS